MRTLSIIISEISVNRHFINEIKTLMKILIFACGVRRVVGKKLLMTFAIRSSAVNVENFCSASSSDFFSFSKSRNLGTSPPASWSHQERIQKIEWTKFKKSTENEISRQSGPQPGFSDKKIFQQLEFFREEFLQWGFFCGHNFLGGMRNFFAEVQGRTLTFLRGGGFAGIFSHPGYEIVTFRTF